TPPSLGGHASAPDDRPGVGAVVPDARGDCRRPGRGPVAAGAALPGQGLDPRRRRHRPRPRRLQPARGAAPASTTKLMTALVATEKLAPEAIVTVSPVAAAQPAMRIGMVAGQQWTLDAAMHSLMMVSANDAAYA